MIAISTNTLTAQQNQSTSDTHQRTYFAQPYSLDANGFYFTDMEEYQSKYDANRDSFGLPVEEYEIQFIDGGNEEGELFQAAGVDQCTLPRFLEIIDELPGYQQAALFYLLQQGRDLEDALNNCDEVQISHESLEDAAKSFFDEIYGHEIPEHLQSYIDYSAFANDLRCNGDFVEFEFAGETYTCTNANSL